MEACRTPQVEDSTPAGIEWNRALEATLRLHCPVVYPNLLVFARPPHHMQSESTLTRSVQCVVVRMRRTRGALQPQQGVKSDLIPRSRYFSIDLWLHHWEVLD
jgi:hypothetical protein